MTVRTRADFDKVLEGDCVPASVGVRRYIPPRHNKVSQNGRQGGGGFSTDQAGNIFIGQNHNNRSPAKQSVTPGTSS